MNILGVTATAYALLQYFVRAREREQAKSEALLLNVLPAPVAARLKEEQGVIADDHAEVTVLFADIVDFTPLPSVCRPPRSWRCSITSSRAGTRWRCATAWRRSRRSATPTWSPAGVPLPREDHVGGGRGDGTRHGA